MVLKSIGGGALTYWYFPLAVAQRGRNAASLTCLVPTRSSTPFSGILT